MEPDPGEQAEALLRSLELNDRVRFIGSVQFEQYGESNGTMWWSVLFLVFRKETSTAWLCDRNVCLADLLELLACVLTLVMFIYCVQSPSCRGCS